MRGGDDGFLLHLNGFGSGSGSFFFLVQRVHHIRAHDDQQKSDKCHPQGCNFDAVHDRFILVPGNAEVHGYFRLKLGLHHADHVFAGFIKTHHTAHQLCHTLNFLWRIGIWNRRHILALVVLGLRSRCPFIDNHRHAQALDVTGGALGVAHGAVNLVVAGAACGNRVALVRTRGGCGLGIARGRGRRRRGVGQGTRYTAGFFGAVAVFADDLGAGFGTLASRVIVFHRGLGLAEIQGQVDLGTHIGITHDGRQNLQHALAIEVFLVLLVLGLASGQTHGQFAGALGHQFAEVVHDHHVVGREQRHAGSNQMHHGLHLQGADGASGLRRHHHRGLGRRAVAHKDRWLGNGQMHPGGLYRLDLQNGACQFLLHGRVVAGLLHELAGRQSRLFFQGIQACGHGFGKSFGRQKDAGRVVAVGRHGDLAVGAVNNRFVVCGFQRLEHGLLIALGHTGHHGAVRGLVHGHKNDRKQQAHQRNHQNRQSPLDRGLRQGALDRAEQSAVILRRNHATVVVAIGNHAAVVHAVGVCHGAAVTRVVGRQITALRPGAAVIAAAGCQRLLVDRCGYKSAGISKCGGHIKSLSARNVSYGVLAYTGIFMMSS